MSKPYLLYTEYYIISGAYFIIDVINGALTHSASYSDIFKGYLHSKVTSKQIALNEFIRSQNDSKINNNLNDNDIDEDGFVVIKTRRSKKNKTNLGNTNDSSYINSSNEKMHQNNDLKNDIHSYIIREVVDDIIKDVIKKLQINKNVES